MKNIIGVKTESFFDPDFFHVGDAYVVYTILAGYTYKRDYHALLSKYTKSSLTFKIVDTKSIESKEIGVCIDETITISDVLSGAVIIRPMRAALLESAMYGMLTNEEPFGQVLTAKGLKTMLDFTQDNNPVVIDWEVNDQYSGTYIIKVEDVHVSTNNCRIELTST